MFLVGTFLSPGPGSNGAAVALLGLAHPPTAALGPKAVVSFHELQLLVPLQGCVASVDRHGDQCLKQPVIPLVGKDQELKASLSYIAKPKAPSEEINSL